MHAQMFQSWCTTLSHAEFEQFVRDVFTGRGWTARCTPSSRDRGFDVLLTSTTPNERRQRLLEVKQRDGGRVGRVPVQKLVGVGCEYGVLVVVLVTNASYTSTAIETAQRINQNTPLRVHLVDGRELYDRIQETGQRQLIRRYDEEL